jgi:hypothetical protein
LAVAVVLFLLVKMVVQVEELHNPEQTDLEAWQSFRLKDFLEERLLALLNLGILVAAVVAQGV